jgi:hypothetical protein
MRCDRIGLVAVWVAGLSILSCGGKDQADKEAPMSCAVKRLVGFIAGREDIHCSAPVPINTPRERSLAAFDWAKCGRLLK